MPTSSSSCWSKFSGHVNMWILRQGQKWKKTKTSVDYECKERITFFVLWFLDVIFSSVSTTLAYRINKALDDYSYFYNQVIYPSSFTLCVIPLWCIIRMGMACYRHYKYKKIMRKNADTYLPTSTNGNGGRSYHEDDEIVLTTKEEDGPTPSASASASESEDYNVIDEESSYVYNEPTKELTIESSDSDDSDSTGLATHTKHLSRQSQKLLKSVDQTNKESIFYNLRHYWKIFFLMALLDTIKQLLWIPPIVYLPSMFVLLLGPLVFIPNMIGSCLFLGKKFKVNHYAGVSLVIFSVVLASFPAIDKYLDEWKGAFHNNTVDFDFIRYNSSLFGGGGGGPINQTTNGDKPNVNTINVWIFLVVDLVLVKILSAASSLYSEAMLKTHELDPFTTVTITAAIQAIIAPLALFVLAIPFPPPGFHLDWSQFPDYAYNASVMFFGNPSNVLDVSIENPSRTSLKILFAIFLGANIADNVISVVIIKKFSATFNIISGISSLIVTVFFLNWPFLAGEAYSPMTLYEFFALILVVIGTIIYRHVESTEELEKYTKKKYNQERKKERRQARRREQRGGSSNNTTIRISSPPPSPSAVITKFSLQHRNITVDEESLTQGARILKSSYSQKTLHDPATLVPIALTPTPRKEATTPTPSESASATDEEANVLLPIGEEGEEGDDE